MKKSLFLLLAIVALGISEINAQTYITIPDANFAGWLNNVYPTCMNGNQMNIECAAVTSATNVNIQSYSIANLSGIEHFTSLQFLNCSFNQLTSLPSLPSTLLNLNCLGNQLTSLPELPQSLLVLNCSGNPNLSSLPAYPPNLENLSMGGTNINLNDYGPLPQTLISLSLQFGQHTELPALPSGLLTLMCGTNPLGSLPELPATLTNLACNNNQLTSLPALPPNLIYLTCPGNNLTSIPELPSTLVSLYCENNQLTSLPALPAGITIITAHSNLLTSLPELPAALTYFECYNNQLNELPALPPLLNNFYCQNNQLTSFPEIPASMLILNASYNQITCWPTIPNMPSPNLTNNPFTCLPNYIPSMGVFGLLDYPLCEDGDLTNNPFGCESAKGVTGKIYADENSDCDLGAGENGLVNIPVSLFDALGNFVSYTTSAGNGVYFLSGDTLEYTLVVDTLNKPYQPSCDIPGAEANIVFSPGNQLIQNMNFGMECRPGFDVGVQSAVATGFVFPGQPHQLRVVAGDLTAWYGLNCAAGVSGSVTISVNGPVSYVEPAAGALSPTFISGNDFIYDITDFSLVSIQNDFSLWFNADTTAQAGDLVCVTVVVTPLIGDNDINNNNYQYCYEVVNSYDPNIKTVWPGNVEPGFDGYFNYTIYFQNTGNAPAFNIRVADTLDTNLDLSTFEVRNYSHDCLTYLHGNVATFRFNNIMLPDSTSDLEGSIGFVQYRIKPVADLPVGTVIENTAHIFFDFNDAIVTNTTQNEFMILTSIENSLAVETLNVYPNPGTGIFNLKWNNENGANTIIEVYNIRGERIINTSTNLNPTTLDLSGRPAGMYLVRINSQGNTMQTKVILR